MTKQIFWQRIYKIALSAVIVSLLITACGSFSTQSANGQEAKVTDVEVIVAESYPPQYFAVASGQLPDSCTEIDRSTQMMQAQTIKITLTTTRPDDAVCTTAMQPFEETIRINVDGLSAGQYTVEVNGVPAPLNLTEDN
jgi:inhibitor of cysteine peptidase